MYSVLTRCYHEAVIDIPIDCTYNCSSLWQVDRLCENHRRKTTSESKKKFLSTSESYQSVPVLITWNIYKSIFRLNYKTHNTTQHTIHIHSEQTRVISDTYKTHFQLMFLDNVDWNVIYECDILNLKFLICI